MRKIIHIDMDAFFAAVEMRDNPSLKNVPMAIGGAVGRRGVISTANYEARKFGVKSAMPSALALKLCPDLILINGDISKYKAVSDEIFKIFYEFTDKVEGLSLDEAYLDVTDCPLYQNSATLIAEAIRKEIFSRTSLTASAGIAPNKLIAKMASDIKKPNGQFTISPDSIQHFIEQVPVERLWGVGKVTAKFLHQLGVKTCLDLQRYTRSELIHHLGKFGNQLYDYCRGIDDRDVEIEYDRKSLGTEETFSKDITQFEILKGHLLRLFEELQTNLENYQDRIIKNLHVKIKYFDFKLTTIERQLPFCAESFIFLLEERWAQDPRSVRLLGVGVKFECLDKFGQLPLFDGV